MIKKIFLVLASLFLCYQSLELLRYPEHLTASTWWGNLLVAWVVNMLITGIFALSGFALPTQKLLPEAYYRIHQPRQLKQAAKWMHLHAFQAFLLATFWRSKKQQKQFFAGTKSGLLHFKTESEKAEFGHITSFVVLLVVGVYLAIRGSLSLGAWILFWNILGNLYPVVLQRYHRVRIQPLLNRL